MEARRLSVFMLLLILMLSFAYLGCGGDYGGFPQILGDDPPPTKLSYLINTLKAMNIDRYMGIDYIERWADRIDPEWDIYSYDPADCKCIFEDDFYVAARENAEASNVIFLMAGGGACWPGQADCASKAQSIDKIDDNLISNRPANPVAGWDVVWVPYCDGSVHLGDSDAEYDGDGQVDHWHWGLKTTSAAVTLMKELFPSPEKILITGCSAGGNGTIIATLLIRLAYPNARLYVMNDSGPGLFDPAKPDTWQLIKNTWNIEPLLPDDCPECHNQLIYLYQWMLARDGNLKVGLFSSYQDKVIGEYYLGMNPSDYEDLLMAESGAIRQFFPDAFKRYFINGSSHCIFDYSYEVNGISIMEWIGYLVNDENQWVDVLE